MTGSPTFSYYGGKASKLSWLLPLLDPPRNRAPTVFVDACCGSAVVAIELRKLFLCGGWNRGGGKQMSFVINDIYDEVYNFFVVLRDKPDALIGQLRLTPYSRTEYLACLNAEPTDDVVERARRFFTIVTQSFGRSAKGDSGWSRTSTDRIRAPSEKLRRGRLTTTADLLQDFDIENMDVLKLLAMYGGSDNCLIYIDPPYPHKTRKTKANYAVEQGEEWHEKFLESVKEISALCAISTYPNDIYERALAGWHKHELATTTPYKTKDPETRLNTAQRTEVLYTNYKPATRVEFLL